MRLSYLQVEEIVSLQMFIYRRLGVHLKKYKFKQTVPTHGHLRWQPLRFQA